MVTGGKGIEVSFSNGATYIDAMSSMNCVNIGYGNQRVAEAIAKQARELAYYHSFLGVTNEPSVRLADRLLNELLPEQMSRIMFYSSGSEAVDAALKCIWMYNYLRGKPEKTKIISRKGSYHGVTLGAASVSGSASMRKGFNLPLPAFLLTENFHYFRDAEPGESERDYSRRLGADPGRADRGGGSRDGRGLRCRAGAGRGLRRDAAGGLLRGSHQGPAQARGAVLRRRMHTGFGGTGKWFACTTSASTPNPTSWPCRRASPAPISHSPRWRSRRKIWRVLRDGIPSEAVPLYATGSTASGHPIACAAANENIDVMIDEDLMENSRTVGAFLKQRLAERIGESPLIGEIRGEGLMVGLDLVADKATKAILDPAWDCAHRLVELCRERET